MKTKFKVNIHSTGFHLEGIVQMIASHNEGKAVIDINTIASYVQAHCARSETLRKETFKFEGIDVLHISSRYDKAPYVTITECLEVGVLDNEAAKECPTLFTQKVIEE